VKRAGVIEVAAGVALCVGSGYVRFQGARTIASLFVAAGIALVIVGFVRIYRSRPKDDTFKRFAGTAFLADPRSPLFCTCGHELRAHKFHDEGLECQRCETKDVSNPCTVMDRST
jgi:hypothetical protein